MIDANRLTRLVTEFPEDEKSRELLIQLLMHTSAPFSRNQFTPGHITSTGLVLHPSRAAFLVVFHGRLERWLLPGGHVEPEDSEIYETARREVKEETGARLTGEPGHLVGIDVHGIPPRGEEPFHLHHDLIFAFRSASPEVLPTEEVRHVVWCDVKDMNEYSLPMNIRQCAARTIARQNPR